MTFVVRCGCRMVATMSSTRASSGTLYGCHWERYGWGVLVYAFDGGDTFRGYVTSRRYVGNGSDRVTVRGSVLAFRREMGVAR